MASNGNFAVNSTLIRPVGGTSRTSTKGNTAMSSSSGSWGAPTTLAANTGKWYVEYYVNTGSSGRNVGVVPTDSQKYNDGDYTQGTSGDYAITINSGGSIYNNGSVTQSVASNMASGDIMGIAMDLDASPKTVQFYKNNSTIGSAENINSSATGPYAFMVKGHNQSTVTINAGQDSSFGGAKTSGSASASDDNGFGDFYYTPPSGFLALCSANLPISSDIDPAQTNDDFPQKNFNTITWSGNGSTQSITGLGFQPDLVWVKGRSFAGENRLTDSSRGANKSILTSTTNAQLTDNGCTAFNSDGFSLGSNGDYNGSSQTYVAWCWRAGGGSTSSNSDGSITTNVQSSTAGGFSIITYTGTGANATIGHGLTQAPNFVMCKNLDDTDYWGIYHTSTGATKYGTLPSASYPTANSAFWNNTAPTNSVIYLGSNNRVNGSSNNMVAYAWHNVEGYIKFGKFEGNANNDGPFVYTGFRPRMLFIKGMDTNSPWVTIDGVRGGGYNDPPNSPSQQFWDETLADHTSYGFSIYSNGFKLNTSNATVNASGTWMFGAWGDVPFKYNNTF